MKEESTEGIVLKAIEYKEKERILTVFTKEVGLISLIVKGISKKKSHLLALSSPLCRAEFLYQKGRSDLYLFCDGSTIENHDFLRQKFSHLQTAGEMLQAILRSQLPGKSSPLLYALLISYLKQIPSFQNKELLLSSFYLKLLKHEGLLQDPLTHIRSFDELKKIELKEQQYLKIKAYFEKAYH